MTPLLTERHEAQERRFWLLFLKNVEPKQSATSAQNNSNYKVKWMFSLPTYPSGHYISGWDRLKNARQITLLICNQ